MTTPHDETAEPAPVRRFRRSRKAQVLLTAGALAAIGAVGVFTTQATFTDQVTMASITVTGGTLDLNEVGKPVIKPTLIKPRKKPNP